MWSGPIRHSPPASAWTPWMRSTFDSIPSICAPSETRKRQRSWTCGSQAALPITVSPGVSTAAMTAFSVAITLASSRKMCSPRRPPRRASRTSRATSTSRAHPREGVDVRVEPAAPDHVAAGRRDAHPAEAREQRAGEQERRAHPAAELRVELGLGDLGGVDADLVRRPSRPRRRRCRRAARASCRRRGSAGRSRASRARSASSVAARIGSAPFLFPAALTVPDSRWPPSITKASISSEPRTLAGIAVG